MKKTIILISLLLLLLFTSCGGSNVVLDVNYQADASTEVFSAKEIDEFHTIVYDYSKNNPYDLESEVAALAEVKMGKCKQDSTTVVCTVSAPDVYSYLMDNQSELMNLEEEELYTVLHNAIENEETGIRTVEVTLPVQHIDDTIVASTDTDEYRDAVSGGMYSALSEIYVSILNDMMEGEK